MILQHYSSNKGIKIPPRIKEGFNTKLFKQIRKQFGPFQHHHIEMTITSEMMFNLLKKIKKKSRPGEVVMIIPNKAGRIWLHTKATYPDGVYRLMTGGLYPHELPQHAFYREVIEETGFQVKIERCLAIISYNFLTTNKATIPFTSYLFLTVPVEGRPIPIDTNELITDFKVVKNLSDTAQHLSKLNGKYADWGDFRAVAHQVASKCLP